MMSFSRGFVQAPTDANASPSEEKREKNPQVFLDLSILGRIVRIVIELFADLVPKTAENFRALCTGEKGLGRITRKPLHYKGTEIWLASNRVAAAVIGGNISPDSKDFMTSRVGESIYGGTFHRESCDLSQNKRGLLCMYNDVSERNGSKFSILLREMASPRYGHYTVFGNVIKGIETLINMPEMPVTKPIIITDCGEIPKAEKRNVGPPPTKAGLLEKEPLRFTVGGVIMDDDFLKKLRLPDFLKKLRLPAETDIRPWPKRREFERSKRQRVGDERERRYSPCYTREFERSKQQRVSDERKRRYSPYPQSYFSG